VFVKTAREGPAGRPVTAEQTHVAVINRAWVTGILDANAKGKRKTVEWVRSVGDKVKDGTIELKGLPKIDGGEGREFPSQREAIKFFDLRREELNKEKEKQPQLPAVFAAVEKFVRPGVRFGSPVVRVNFVFERYTPLATRPVLAQDEPQKGALRRKTANNALAYTPFDNLLAELNVELMREAFPPKGDKIEYVRPATGVPYYEWRTKDGWLVNCRTDDGVTIEWLGDKGP
jgi:hypothetical protein